MSVRPGPEDPARVAGKRVLLVSPHYDDVPLALGQSLLDGALSEAARVAVKIVFGHTNWSVSVHPTRERAPLITAWRRAEELAAAVRFGYRVSSEPLEEVILRTGSLDQSSFRGSEDVEADPLVERIASMLWDWHTRFDVMWVPAGLGRHLDHRLVALAGARLLEGGAGGIAFYEDRPYTAYLEPEEIAEQLAELGVDLEKRPVSSPVTDRPQRWVRRIYRSQVHDGFRNAQIRDRETGTPEQVWVPRRAD